MPSIALITAPPARRAAVIALAIGLFAIATDLRVRELDSRPVHGDEAVNAVKAWTLYADGEYRFDPDEFHGATLPYLAATWFRVLRPQRFSDVTLDDLRALPVVFGIASLGLWLLAWRGLGATAGLATLALGAVSSSLVFFSRDFVHESLLAGLGLAALLCAWRALVMQPGRGGWIVATAALLSLQQATKETVAIHAVGLGVAIGLAFWSRRRAEAPVLGRVRWRVWAIAALVYSVIYALFYSSFGHNWPGLIDGLRTFGRYFAHGTEDGVHVHAWSYYFELMNYSSAYPKRVFSEGLISGLGVVALFGLRTRRSAEPARELRVMLASYVVVLVAIYSMIPYKTPWCALNFWLPLTGLAGLGAADLLRIRSRVARGSIAVVLIALTVQLGTQSFVLNGKLTASYYNPYVYAQPLRQVEDLAAFAGGLAAAIDLPRDLPIQVTCENCWPLPWYLRAFDKVAYTDGLPEGLIAPVVIVDFDDYDAAVERLGDAISFVYGLRPGTKLVVFVDRELYKAFQEANP